MGLLSPRIVGSHFLGSWEFLVNAETLRRQNSLGEVFLAAVPVVAATECGNQQ
jgi:hypothetical protein